MHVSRSRDVRKELRRTGLRLQQRVRVDEAVMPIPAVTSFTVAATSAFALSTTTIALSTATFALSSAI